MLQKGRQIEKLFKISISTWWGGAAGRFNQTAATAQFAVDKNYRTMMTSPCYCLSEVIKMALTPENQAKIVKLHGNI